MSARIRSRMADLQTHCWPIDKAAVREMLPPPRPVLCGFECPPLHRTPIAEMVRIHGGAKFSDITGLRSGSMTVVGLLRFNGCGNSKWVARCVCGRYEERNYRQLLLNAEKGRPSRCHICSRDEWKDGKSVHDPRARSSIAASGN